MFHALGAAIANIIATTINKHLLSKERMDVLSFGIWLFIFLFAITALTLPWIGWVDFELALSDHYLYIFLIMILIATIWNFYYYYCLQKDTLADFQLVVIVQPLLAVFLSMLLFSDERSDKVLIATIIAGVTLILSHLHRWRIENFKVTVPLFIAIVLASVETLFHKELLVVYSPAALYFTRTFIIATILFLANPGHISKVTPKNLWQTFVISFFAVLTMILSFYGYQIIGIAKTNIIMLLYPIATTIISIYILKERIKKRKVVALIIIVLCIIYAFLNGN
ncbi:DMT family transporter [Patescibacteria group bacterium]|nr:DMT family transporter [Patescibacteria group bacterium]